MANRTIAVCPECGQGYAARQRTDGSFVVATEDGNCQCGNGTFQRFPEAATV